MQRGIIAPMSVLFMTLNYPMVRLYSWKCRIHQLPFCRVVNNPQKCPGYDTKYSRVEAQLLEFCGM